MTTKRFHTIFDLENCNSSIGNPKIIQDFIKELVKAINMKIIGGPIMAEGGAEAPGLSVLAIIDYSHVSIHSFTNNGEILIDVFSCREYDRDKALEICKKYFFISETKLHIKEVSWG